MQQPFNLMNMNPMNYNMLGMHPNLAKHVKFPNQPHQPNNHYNTNNQNNQFYVNKNQQMPKNNQPMNKNRNDEPDVKYMESLEDEMARKDYLGEFIFKMIENHEFTQRKQLTIDTIGKITGMILGIEDLLEIVEISKDNHQLTSRIQEALELLEGDSK
jgi:hypothetical protein